MRPGVPACARNTGTSARARRRNWRRCRAAAAAGVASVAPPCCDIDVRIHAAGRVRDDARAGERFGDQRRHVRIHRPGQVLVAGRAELAARHEHDVRHFGQRLDLIAVEQVGLDAFDAPAVELFAQALFAEACDADHAPSGAARLAIRASVGPILPPTPRMMMSPDSFRQVRDKRRRSAWSSPLRDDRRRESVGQRVDWRQRSCVPALAGTTGRRDAISNQLDTNGLDRGTHTSGD